MPKAINPTLPLNGLFAVVKPTGMTCMPLLDKLGSLFADSPLFVGAETLDKHRGMKKRPKKRKGNGPVKIGQGGTLDPLADGVLVIGIGKGTKSLGEFLHCTKEYKTTALFGCETDSYDSEGARVRLAPWSHVTRQALEETLAKFSGNIKQVPPIYSALKMDGKPLYEYAREGKPLPRPIEARDANVLELEVVDWQEARTTPESSEGHTYTWPTKELSEADKQRYDGVKDLVAVAEAQRPSEEDAVQLAVSEPPAPPAEIPASFDELENKPPVFTLKMTVSSGTYVRSLVHDIAAALGSAAHVVSLQRSRQGSFGLGDAENEGDCVPWEVLNQAYEDQKAGVPGSPLGAITDQTLLAEWERVMLSKWHT